MQIRNLLDMFIVIDELYSYLKEKPIEFDESGFPIFRKKMFLDEWPDLVITYSNRNNSIVSNRKKTVICFYDKDHRLYPRLGKLLNEIEEYKTFMGVIGLDITITDDMDEEWQRLLALVNQLMLAVLAVNGIKIIVNTRTAGLNPQEVFGGVPKNATVASGFLGCNKLQHDYDFSYIEKIVMLMPSKVILYGKHDVRAEKQLENMGIDYRVYSDFHRLCKEVRYGR